MNKEDLENTPDYQEWRLSYATLRDIDSRIESMKKARVRQCGFYKDLKAKFTKTCSANGHFYGEEEIKKVEDGEDRVEGSGCTDDSGVYHEGEVTYIVRYKRIAIKTCSLCHYENKRDAIKTEVYS